MDAMNVIQAADLFEIPSGDTDPLVAAIGS
jgi:hypothetical protein